VAAEAQTSRQKVQEHPTGRESKREDKIKEVKPGIQ
jgi:hypothetical protein